ncbi:hypothetical protein [Kineococcus sp. NPDC059986]|jgi:hypothetical protein|uniref:TolB family protein n=1 Tax=Kineococcus sp. NPDC059986 TaxID=3155538 RepID=UPI00344C42C7
MSSRRLPLLVALCVLVLGTVAVLAVAALPGQRRPPSRSVVPEVFPGYSPLTAAVATNPVGAAVAVYRQEAATGIAGVTQTLVLGADGSSTRVLTQAAVRGGALAGSLEPAATVLSPDGRTVAVGDGPSTAGANGGTTATRPGVASSTLALVDLGTGDTRVHVVPRVPTVVPLSWSADSTRLAYLGTSADAGSEAGSEAGAATGQLFVFDARSERAVAVPGAQEVVAAAFSPDGSLVAFQTPGSSVVRVVAPFAPTPADGTPESREVPVPAGAVLADGPAWSPDGSLLALTAGAGTPSARIEFVAAGADRDVPAAVPGQDVLGWSSAGVLVHGTAPSSDGDLGVVRTELRTGATQGYLRVPTDGGHHPAGDLTLASALLARAVSTSSSSVDRGPWPLPVRLGFIAAAAVLSVPATVGLLRRRDRWAALTAVPEWARDTTRG